MAAQKSKKTTGMVLDDGSIVEMVHDRYKKSTALLRFTKDGWREQERIQRSGLPDLVPYAADNPLVEERVVLFPSRPEAYGTDSVLLEEIRSFIHRYVDVSKSFEMVAAVYVLLSWVHDAFNELPYMRVRGDFGSGKTRFLLVVGSIVYKPIFGSGASTVSPLFHLLEEFGGTLVMDEADFRFSDEKADLAKIMNNGTVRGFPVLRAVGQRNGEFRPRAFHVYGPKIIASRGSYADKALESRFISEDMGTQLVRSDVPINLPKDYEREADELRNKLLMYRFSRRSSVTANRDLVDRNAEPRLNQILVPLLSVTDDREIRQVIAKRVQDDDARRRGEMADTIEGKALTILGHLLSTTSKIGVSVGDVAVLYRAHVEEQGMGPMSDRRMGMIIRTRLGLHTQKSHGRFIVTASEKVKLVRLYRRYGIVEADVEEFGQTLRDKFAREAGNQQDVGSSGTSSEEVH